MSAQMPPPGDQQDGPSEEEVRQYLTQLRGAPVDQVLAEVVQGLLNAAQVKLGRNDARLLLDTCAAIVDTVRGQAAPELVDQVDQALSQLRLAQVEAEREGASGDEPNDTGATEDAGGQPTGETPPAGTGQQAPPQQPTQQPSQSSRLWVPGQ